MFDPNIFQPVNEMASYFAELKIHPFTFPTPSKWPRSTMNGLGAIAPPFQQYVPGPFRHIVFVGKDITKII
jgi:hypothetical protein